MRDPETHRELKADVAPPETPNERFLYGSPDSTTLLYLLEKLGDGLRLVVGHSNTIPAIVTALGAPQPPPICDSQYDDLYVVTMGATRPAHVIRARYGAPSPTDAGCAAMKP